MPVPRWLPQPPRNLGAFVAECTAGIGELHGARAAREYEAVGPSRLVSAFRHPAISVLGAMEGREAVALLMIASREYARYVSFIHVLEPYRRQGLEGMLVEMAVRALRADASARGIVCDFAELCPLELDGAFSALGFDRVPRAIMVDAMDEPNANETEVDGLEFRDWPRAAPALVAAYAGTPDGRLLVETHSELAARRFLAEAAAGAFGSVRPGYLPCILDDGVPVAAALGCEAAAGVGYVLQVFADPGHRRKGYGRRVVEGVTAAFRAAGLERALLTVSQDNPARSLYEKMGFKTLRETAAYVRWRDGIMPQQ